MDKDPTLRLFEVDRLLKFQLIIKEFQKEIIDFEEMKKQLIAAGMETTEWYDLMRVLHIES